MSDVTTTIEGQRSWALRSGLELAEGGKRLIRTSDAIFGEGPTKATETELDAGAGGEMQRLTSLRSSSALAVNVFESWRHSPGGVAPLLGGDTSADSLAFEFKAPIGVRRTPPHLDVLIKGGTVPVAVESKFLELYAPARNTFADAYFKANNIWAGIPACRRIAENMDSGDVRFLWLAAAQLIKHTLGLRQQFPDGFRLWLLWYRIPGSIAEEIEAEIDAFSRSIYDEVDFAAMTYQELFPQLATLDEPRPGYLNYLQSRYFPEIQLQ